MAGFSYTARMPKQFDPRRLDLRRFAEEAASLDGVTPAQALPRIAAEVEATGAAAQVQWAATGELRNPEHLYPQVWLHLHAQASLALTCQRCLQPVEVQIALDRPFRFAADEATASAEDDAAEEEVLAFAPVFDLLELLEDELLMDLPVAPRHDECPVPVKMSATDPAFLLAEAARENPFAVLGRLKTGKS